MTLSYSKRGRAGRRTAALFLLAALLPGFPGEAWAKHRPVRKRTTAKTSQAPATTNNTTTASTTPVPLAQAIDREVQAALKGTSALGVHVIDLGFFDRVGADWSPDGSQVAFAAFLHRHLGLFVVNADGTGLREITPPADSERDGTARNPLASDGSTVRGPSVRGR